MTFKRPTNITLTAMAQWVDSIDTNSAEQDKLVEYLYHLSYYNAQQKSLFNNLESYDDFAIFCVTKLLTRLNNKKCAPVKSVVNYINNVLAPWHSEYIRTFCSGSPDVPTEDFDLSDFGDYLVDASSVYDFNAYSVCHTGIADVMRKHIQKIPRKRNSAEWSNIYLSCLLTLQDRLECASELRSNIPKEETKLLSRMIRQLKTRPPVLFHIEEHMASYITVLVNEIIHAVANDLTYTTHCFVSPATCLKNLAMAASNEEDN